MLLSFAATILSWLIAAELSQRSAMKYDKEGEELKKSKLAEKKRKKQMRLERRNEHPKARKILKIINKQVKELGWNK